MAKSNPAQALLAANARIATLTQERTCLRDEVALQTKRANEREHQAKAAQALAAIEFQRAEYFRDQLSDERAARTQYAYTSLALASCLIITLGIILL